MDVQYLVSLQQPSSHKYTSPHLQETQQNKLLASSLAGHVTVHKIHIRVVQFPMYFMTQEAILSSVSTEVQGRNVALYVSHYGELDVWCLLLWSQGMYT
jgi:hypothetical protein